MRNARRRLSRKSGERQHAVLPCFRYPAVSSPSRPYRRRHAAAWYGRNFLLRPVGDHRFGGDHEAGNRRGVLKRHSHHFRGIDDASAEHVDILLRLGVEAVGLRFVFENLAHDDRTLDAGVFNNLTDRRLERFQGGVDADCVWLTEGDALTAV
jgi:hypothetical protein